MKLGGENIWRGVDATTELGEYSVPSALLFVKDTSDTLGTASGITNVTEVNNIINSIIGATTINNFYDVDPNLPDAPYLSLMTMGVNGQWTYSAPYEYTLPQATESVLGGVTVGYGLNVIAGEISIDPLVIPSSDITSTQITHWDTAYDWGDHSLAGYALDSALSRYSTTSHTHTTFLSLSGGTMLNDTLVTNLNAEFLNGHEDSYFSVAHSHPYLSDSNPKIAQWDSAYSWGDHADAGYLTAETPETDPVFTAWDKTTGISIVATQVSDFTTAVNANTRVAAAYSGIHNPVTIGTANGLSISTQAISLRLADSTHSGALSSTDWVRFNALTVVADYQPLEDQRLSTTDDVVFNTISAPYVTSTAIVDDTSTLDSLAGFEAANGTIQRFTAATAQTFLGLGPNAYTSDDFYLDANPDGFIHEITSTDGSVVITDIVYDPVDATKHGIDLSVGVASLYRYASGTGVEVLATKEGITSVISGQTLTFTIPSGAIIVSAKIRFGSYGSLIVKTGTVDMGNSSISDRWLPVVQAWREDTKSQLMAVNLVANASVFDEFTIQGLINTTTNHIRITF